MIQPNEQEKYIFSKEKERELLVKAFRLYEGNSSKNLTDFFKINLDDLHRVEKFYIQTCMLLYKNQHAVEKLDVPHVKMSTVKGGVSDTNLRFKERVIEPLAEVSLNSIYPIVMMNLGQEVSNHLGFTEMLKDLYIEYKQMHPADIDEGLKDKVKEYINLVYGMLGSNNPNAYIKASIDLSKVPTRVRQIMIKLKNEFPGHYVSIDTDTIYLAHYEEIEFRLEEHLNKLMVQYDPLTIDVTLHDKGIFFEYKQHVIFRKDGSHSMRGFRKIT